MCLRGQQKQDQPREYDVTEREVPTLFLECLSCSDSYEPAWRKKIRTQAGAIEFKLDSGADVTVVSEAILNRLSPKATLWAAHTKLMSPGGPLFCRGQFVAETEVKKQKFRFRVLVIVGTHTDNLLSRGVAVKMGLIRRVDEVSAQDSDLFGDSGCLDCDSVKIRLNSGAVPYSIPVARRVPIPLLPAEEAELQRMVNYWIVERMTDATDWCAPMVVVAKKNNKIRICVDLKRLNRSVVRA